MIMRVKLEALEIRGQSYPIRARYDARVGRFRKFAAAVIKRVAIGNVDRIEESDDGVFEFFEPSSSLVVTSGLESNWLTLAR